MKIVTLIEDGQCKSSHCPDGQRSDSWPSGLLSEHGLSFYIEYRDRIFLLDGGQSEAFSKNAASLGIDLRQVEIAVLSHGHYDHSGGLDWFLSNNKRACLYLSGNCRENCYGGTDYHYIGLRPGFLEDWKKRIAFVKGKCRISEGVWLLPHCPEGRKEREKIGEQCRLYQKKAVPKENGRKTTELSGVREAAAVKGGFSGDDFNHEISLVFQEKNGLVVFNSCSHSGAAEILGEVETAFEHQPILGFFGGLHLSKKTQEEVRAYAGVLREYMEKTDRTEAGLKENEKERDGGKTELLQLYTGHCTGEAACRILEEELGRKVERLFSGYQVELE